MARRSYRQNCALARANDVIGARWTMLLLRDLLISPCRFKDLQHSQQGMGANLLATRLKDLEAAGIVERRAGEGRVQVYALTEAGRALEPALLALIRWGLAYGPENRDTDHHRNDWDLLALKAMFRPERASDLTVAAQFEARDFKGWVRIEEQQMTVGLGTVKRPDLEISGSIPDLFVHTERPRQLLGKGRADTLSRFMHAFALRTSSGHLLVW